MNESQVNLKEATFRYIIPNLQKPEKKRKILKAKEKGWIIIKKDKPRTDSLLLISNDGNQKTAEKHLSSDKRQ